MKATTQAWLAKAELSFEFAQQCMEPPFHPCYDGVCLHSQVGSEQYLNACLRESDIPFRDLQELPVLLEALLTIDSSWNRLRPLIKLLMPQESEFGGFGYPGVNVNKEMAVQSLQSCKRIREIVRSRLMSHE